MKRTQLKTILNVMALLFMGSATMMAQTNEDPFPEVNYHNWQGNMTITCQVELNGDPLTKDVIVAVYNNGEIRGKQAIDTNGKVYLMAGGGSLESQELPLHFKVYTGGRIIEVDQGLKFGWNGEIGSTKDPYIINLTVVTTNTSPEGWATTCLPFNAVVPDGVSVYTASRIEDGVLKIEPVACTILPKDTPVLLKTESKTSYEWLSRVAEGDAEIETNLFKGTTETLDVASNSVLTLGHATDGNKAIGFWLFSGTTVPANRAYLEKSTALARGIAIDWSDETSGIEEMEGGKLKIEDGKLKIENLAGAVYDLQGRRMESSIFRSASPLDSSKNSQSSIQKKGRLMIVNGKKIVVR